MDNLKIAKQNLRTSAPLTTHRLPCREKEFDYVYNYILDQYSAQSGGCLYLAGVPGTGKTATVRGVCSTILENCSKLKIKKDSLIFIEVNGLKLVDPYQLYSQVYYDLEKKRIGARKAGDKLHELFSSSKGNHKFVVLIVDELDSLQTTKQDILYHLFDWPLRPNSKLVVIAIANTLDLPERILDKRVVSRAGFGRLDFQPYKHEELNKIVTARLKGINVFVSKGIQLIARKVASISGDARKVLDICRRAIEIAEDDYRGRDKVKGRPEVTMDHVMKAVNETTSTPKMVYIQGASEFEKNLLRAICLHFSRSGTEEGVCSVIYQYWANLCDDNVNFSEFLQVANSLHESRLILLEPDKVDNQRRIRLIVSTDDIDFALKMDQAS